jgi:hypothetical protein
MDEKWGASHLCILLIRGKKKWYLVGLITQRSLVQIQSPLPTEFFPSPFINEALNLICRISGAFPCVILFIDFAFAKK